MTCSIIGSGSFMISSTMGSGFGTTTGSIFFLGFLIFFLRFLGLGLGLGLTTTGSGSGGSMIGSTFGLGGITIGFLTTTELRVIRWTLAFGLDTASFFAIYV